MDIGIDTNIEVTVVSPTNWEAHHRAVAHQGLWWAPQVVGDTTKTEIDVSISILS